MYVRMAKYRHQFRIVATTIALGFEHTGGIIPVCGKRILCEQGCLDSFHFYNNYAIQHELNNMHACTYFYNRILA